MYAVIVSWPQDLTSRHPDLIVAESSQLARRGAVESLASVFAAGGMVLSQRLIENHPIPDQKTHDGQVLSWLEALQGLVPSLQVLLYRFASNGTYGRGEVVPLDT